MGVAKPYLLRIEAVADGFLELAAAYHNTILLPVSTLYTEYSPNKIEARHGEVAAKPLVG